MHARACCPRTYRRNGYTHMCVTRTTQLQLFMSACHGRRGGMKSGFSSEQDVQPAYPLRMGRPWMTPPERTPAVCTCTPGCELSNTRAHTSRHVETHTLTLTQLLRCAKQEETRSRAGGKETEKIIMTTRGREGRGAAGTTSARAQPLPHQQLMQIGGARNHGQHICGKEEQRAACALHVGVHLSYHA